MRRVLAVCFRALSIDLAQRRRHKAERGPGAMPYSCVLLTRTTAGRTLVAAHCDEAARRGIRAGLTLAEARSLIDPRTGRKGGGPWIEEHSSERDARALHALGQLALAQFSPIVALDPPDGLFLDVAGTERLFGDEGGLCQAVLSTAHRLGLAARLAIAETVGTAWAVARYSTAPNTTTGTIVEPGEEEAALEPLPVASLRLPEETCDALAELGVETVGQLTRLERPRLAARFGGDVCLRLDQAFGRAFEPVTPLVYTTPPIAERIFEGPVKTLAAVLHTAEELVVELASELFRARRGVIEGTLVLVPTDLPARRLSIALARASADPRHLWTILKPKVDTVHLGFGIESMRLVAVRTARLPSRQRVLWAEDAREGDSGEQPHGLDQRIGELVDVLSARLGTDAVQTAHVERSHLPERAYSWKRPGEPREAESTLPNASPETPRPSQLFDPPEPAVLDASDAHEAPARIRWRGIAYRVRRARGPERIARPWWDDSPAWPDSSPHTTRDYFRIETTCGRSLWIFREPVHGRTFVHGEWS